MMAVPAFSVYSRHVSGGGSKEFPPRKFHFPPGNWQRYGYWINSIFSEFLLIEFWADASLMRLPTFR